MMIQKETWVVSGLVGLFLLAWGSYAFRPPQLSKTSDGPLFKSKRGIAVLHLQGPISFSSSSQVSFPIGATALLEQLDAIEEDTNVLGVLIKVNSPGGTVGASQELYSAIKRLKAKRQIPIMATIGDVGASGAYYAILGVDKIYANPGSMVGSIGVILSHFNLTDFADKHGVGFNVYKGGKYKDILSSWRDPTAEEVRLLNDLVGSVHTQFQHALSQNRGLSLAEAKKVAQGQIFSGQQAQKIGLVDALGGYHDALTDLAREVGIKGKPHIIHKVKKPWFDLMTYWQEKLGQMGSSFMGRVQQNPVLK